MSTKQLSPLSKDKSVIGKLISTKVDNPEIFTQPPSNQSIGINTSKSFKFIEDQDIIQPVTHSKVNELPQKFNVSEEECP